MVVECLGSKVQQMIWHSIAKINRNVDLLKPVDLLP
jgi:hypothetical protein